MRLLARMGGAMALTLATAACGGAARTGAQPAAQPVSAQARPVNEADVRFMTDMIGHHAQALVMAAMAEPNGASPSIRTLAARITNAQQDEIRLMQTWLRDRGQPVPEVSASGAMVMAGHEHAHHLMPGMLTAEQLAELRAARGVEFDKRFLNFMIQHHRGATDMVK
ncbi:MAG TPA: DUF305 domain-containing protein, partial [Gemmatimonadaceae bacterium]|nr:DUF305 domain-containing protein [Gemmatimonadaceae bacterium]